MFYDCLQLPALWFLVVLGLLIVSSPVPSLAVEQLGTQPEQAVRAVFEQLLEASKAKDEKTLRTLLTDNYTQVTFDGRTRSKEQRIKETLQVNDRISTISLEEFHVRSYGNVAIALCRVKEDGTSNGKQFDLTLLSTAVFVREGDVWRIAATHVSFAKE